MSLFRVLRAQARDVWHCEDLRRQKFDYLARVAEHRITRERLALVRLCRVSEGGVILHPDRVVWIVGAAMVARGVSIFDTLALASAANLPVIDLRPLGFWDAPSFVCASRGGDLVGVLDLELGQTLSFSEWGEVMRTRGAHVLN